MTVPSRRSHVSEPSVPYQSIGVGTQRTHAVQFYEDDPFLIASVGSYLATGLATGQRVLAVATAAHGVSLRGHLEECGFDVERAMVRGQLTIVNAHELLATFMVDQLPDGTRFRHEMHRIFHGISAQPGQRAIRVFGEMVDVLCAAGNVEGAIRLEELWNELARSESFSLLCAYSMTRFHDGAHTEQMASICGAHAHVIPTERFTQVDGDGRHRVIAMLQQRAHALESEVERGRALERSLRDALARAEAANRAKRDFLAMMSHELRTPLNAIGGHVQLVEMELHGPINDRQREALARVQRSQRHLLALINDVLNLARAESSELDYVIEPVSLVPLAEEVTELLAPLYLGAGLTCRVALEASEQPSIARADREKVYQILLNLLGNAAKFTPAGGSVTVTVGSALPDALRIDVADSGVGMAPDTLERIFQPFVQLGPWTSERQGIGLGLSISRALARGMRGDLAAASTPGLGSILSLTLPRA